ncbi:AAA family ATPase [bacterium]|nr:AAA family ATPase [bacterium]
MIGRQSESQKLIENIQKGQHTLLLGEVGMGKTYLLKQLYSQLDKAIYVESLSPFKPTLLDIISVLHQNGVFIISGLEAEYLSWDELCKKLNRLNLKQLMNALLQNLQGKGYVLLLDHLETATPSMAKKVFHLMKDTTIIGAANKLKPSLKKLWWRFEPIELLPLTKEESTKLLWSLISKDKISDEKLLEQIVTNQANGNPLSICQLTDKVKRESKLTTESIRELTHQAGAKFIDLTPGFR